MNNIGENISKLRKEKGVSKRILAKAIGVPKKTLSQWEKGVLEPALNKLPVIADYFNISLDSFFNRKFIKKDKANKEDDIINSMMKKCWNLQLNYFEQTSNIKLDREKISNGTSTSQIVTEKGFTNIKNNLGYVLLLEPNNGWNKLFENHINYTYCLTVLSNPYLIKILRIILVQEHSFTIETIIKESKLTKEECKEIMKDLFDFKIVYKETVTKDSKEIEIYKLNKHILPILLVIFSFTNELLNFNSSFNYYSWERDSTLGKEVY